MLMKDHISIVDHLRELIGSNVRHHGIKFVIIEILEDGPALVLQDCEHHTTIQADQHGEAHRRVPKTRTVTIPVDEDGAYNLSEVHVELLD